MTGAVGPTGPQGPAGTGNPGPQGPAGPPGTGAYTEDVASFAGFTAATYSGNMGGRPAAHAACGAVFTGAHLCHASEYVLSNSATPVPATGAWLDASITPSDSFTVEGSHLFGRNTDSSCLSFTTTSSSYTGTYLQANGEATWGSSNCGTSRALACCNGTPKIVFAGFTTAAYTGSMGGRPAAHAICGAELPGSHLCHAAEYVRSVSDETVPAGGAWVDASVDHAGGFTVEGAPSFGRNTDSSCLSFTTASTSYTGTYLQTNGEATWGSSNCQTARRLACCF